MGKKNNIVVPNEFQTFTFSDEDGEVISSFKINPTDINLASRCEEVSKFFEEQKQKLESGFGTSAEAAEFNRMLEEKIDYMLGYDASNTLFKAPLTATTILEDGTLFLSLVLDVIYDAIAPEIEKRKASVSKAMNKYAGKYQA